MKKYVKVNEVKEIIDALDALIDFDTDEAWVETHKLLSGGAYTVYRWSKEDDQTLRLEYMGEVETYTADDIASRWQEEFGKNMFFCIYADEHVTLLGDGESWVGGINATAYAIDERVSGALAECDKGYELLKYPALAAPVLDMQAMSKAVGNFSPDEVTALFELARIALSDAVIFDEVATSSDLSDDELKKIQHKLEKHMQGV